MPAASLDNGKILISDVQYRDRDAVKEIPGSAYKGGQWTIPLTWPALAILKDVFGDKLTLGKSVTDWAWQEYETRIRPTMEARERALDRELNDLSA